MRIKFISMVITGFHDGDKLFATVQFAEEGEASPYQRFRSTSFFVDRETTLLEIGKMVIERINGNSADKEKKKLYEELKAHYGDEYEKIDAAIKEASQVVLGREADSLFTVPDYKFGEFADYIRKVILRREK